MTISIVNMVRSRIILYILVYKLLQKSLMFPIPCTTVNVFLYFPIPKLWFLHKVKCCTKEGIWSIYIHVICATGLVLIPFGHPSGGLHSETCEGALAL